MYGQVGVLSEGVVPRYTERSGSGSRIPQVSHCFDSGPHDT